MDVVVHLPSCRRWNDFRDSNDATWERVKLRTFYVVIIGGMLLVLGMLFYPSLHDIVGVVDRTGFLPLLSTSLIVLPYVFLGFILYGILRMVRR